jgi:hypothetical protein
MNYDLLEARYVAGFTIWLRSREGRSGYEHLRVAA